MKAGTKSYINNVIKEINNIKINATKEEIDKLNIETLTPSDGYQCIYGQMTGYCFNFRAVELIQLCCKTKTSFYGLLYNETQDVKPRQVKPRQVNKNINSFSYLEHFISNYKENNKNIIDYIKEKTETLTLTK